MSDAAYERARSELPPHYDGTVPWLAAATAGHERRRLRRTSCSDRATMSDAAYDAFHAPTTSTMSDDAYAAMHPASNAP